MEPAPHDVEFDAVHGDGGLVLEGECGAKIAAQARLAKEDDIGARLRNRGFDRRQVGIGKCASGAGAVGGGVRAVRAEGVGFGGRCQR